LEHRELITVLKTHGPGSIPFKNELTQLSQGSNELDAAVSNMDGSFWRATCIYSTELTRTFWNKMSFSILENDDFPGLFLSKITSI
jgi:hypothetical protein